jgi:quinolinate synthase
VVAEPDAEVFVHPECGCATSAMWLAGTGDLPAERTHVLSTGGMLDQARRTTAKKVLVATEVGMLHQLRQASPGTVFEPVNPRASCRFMKMTTPHKLLGCLRDGTGEIRVAPDVAARARRSVEAMVAIGSAGAHE